MITFACGFVAGIAFALLMGWAIIAYVLREVD